MLNENRFLDTFRGHNIRHGLKFQQVGKTHSHNGRDSVTRCDFSVFRKTYIIAPEATFPNIYFYAQF